MGQGEGEIRYNSEKRVTRLDVCNNGVYARSSSFDCSHIMCW